ncbi:MAG: nuclear transport factor 2 family protein [Euzebyaceae bacterium]|jgi:hypothetical protein|nr:nuclear transport factor 2 family protein [Euzebyaceae bacterium]
MTDPLEAVEAHLAAFNARNLEAVSAGFCDDAVFATGDDLIIGRRGISAFFAEAFAQPLRAELRLLRSVTDGDTVACEVAERLTLDDGRSHELALAAFYTVRDAALARVKVYREDGSAFAASQDP